MPNHWASRAFYLLPISSLYLNQVFSQIFNFDSPPTVYPAPNGLSSACSATFNQSLSCYEILPEIALQGHFPSNDDLYALCTGQCLQSLETFRDKQLGACQADVFVVGGVGYSPTVLIDNLIFTYNYTCKTDSSTKAFCAPVVDRWGNGTATSTDGCSDCLLGTLQLELNSPFGFDAGLAKNFTSIVSSCGKSYPITSPAPYTVSATRTAATRSQSVAAPTCTPDYTITAGDTCNTISLAHNVSTFDLLYNNGLESYCANFPSAGHKLCLPHACEIYTVQSNDSCHRIVQAHHNAFTISQMVSWNININRDCSNMDQLVGSQICISFPGDSALTSTTTNTTAKAPTPPNVANGTNINCARYYNISSGDYCALVTVQQRISLQDFYFLNAGVNSTCGNLVLGESYCVQAVGDIAIYPGYVSGSPSSPQDPCKAISAPDSCFATTYPTADYWTWPAYTTTPTLSTISILSSSTEITLSSSPTESCASGVPAPEQTQPGIPCWCQKWVKQQTGKYCQNMADDAGISLAQLYSLNPPLNGDCSGLFVGYAYCVGPAPPTVTTASVAPNPTCAGGTAPPEQTQAGISCKCNRWIEQQKGKYCQDMADLVGINLQTLYKLNPALKNDCSGLFVGYAYCVGVAS